ncbi:MAG: hypothetical protein Q8R57_03030 [Bacteroidota bacterium]|nr:hypothetical protein [Bacteroidota bacterium]
MINRFHIFLFLFVFGVFDSKEITASERLIPQKTNVVSLEGWRIGFGLGYAFYLGDQMDFKLTKKYGEFSEYRPNFTMSAFKQTSLEKEWGLVLKFGGFHTFNKEPIFMNQCDFTEIQAVWQRSLNDNIGLNNGRFTANVQYGLGLIRYKSQYFAINPNFETIDYVVSSVGYDYANRTNLKGDRLEDIPEKRIALIGNIGLNMGVKIARSINLYWENSLQISSTGKLSGNLLKTSIIPDGYFYTGINLFWRIGAPGGKMGCPRF